MAEKYILKDLNGNFDLWDKLLLGSPQCNIYLSSLFLNSINRKIKFYLIFKTNEPIAGISLLVSENDTLTEFDEIVIYNGIFFIDRQDKRLTGTRVEQFEVTDFAIKELDKIYKTIVMRLHPSFNDIRPFLWHNYNGKNNKFSVDVRYTSYLEFNKNNDNIDYLLPEMSSIRRQQIRYGKESNSKVNETEDIEKFIDIYCKLIDGTENAINASFKERLKHLISTLLSNKLAVMFECKDSSEKTTYMAIFSCFNNKATYMYGSPNKLNQRTFDGTYMLWESFKVLFEKYKIEEVDLEGVNSPFRGKYKLSFGGKLMTYYEVALK